MRLPRSLWALFIGSIITGLVYVVVRQSRENDALHSEANALRTVVQTLNTERIAREALVKLEPKPEEIKEWADGPTEEARLQTEIERLTAEIAALPTPPKSRPSNPSVASYSHLERILNLAQRGATEELVDLITLDPSDAEQAEMLFAQLPAEPRRQLANAKQLIATVVGLKLWPPGTTGPVVSKKTLLKDKGCVTYHLQPQGIPPTPGLAAFDCVLRRTKEERWLLVVSPEMMASYRESVALAAAKK